MKYYKLVVIATITFFLYLYGWGNGQESIDFSAIFGSQKISNSFFKSIDKAKYYDISLTVLKGNDIVFEKSENSIITLDDGKLKKSVKPDIMQDRTYVFTKMKLKPELGWRVYNCSVKITEGKLKGAVVHLSDGMVPESITDAYQAYYLLPKKLHVSKGKLNYEIIDFASK